MSGVSRVVRLLKKHSLLQYKKVILENIIPSIRLHRHYENARITGGISKVGGVPDVPLDFSWPVHPLYGQPLSFLAQINLCDAADCYVNSPLPSCGMLYFFYDAENQPWGFDPADKNSWKVIYAQTNSNLLPALPLLSSKRTCSLTEARLAFSLEMTIPSWESHVFGPLTQGAINRLAAFEEDFYGKPREERISRLLGNPDFVQADIRVDCQLASNGVYCGDASWRETSVVREMLLGVGEWQLLLQLDSDEDPSGKMWGDMGRLYFMMRLRDFHTRDFNNVWTVLSSS